MTLRLAVAHFFHETVSFLPDDTVYEDFTYPGSPARDAALLGFGAGSYIGGFTRMAAELRPVTLLGITSPLWSRRSSGSGWIRQDAFERLLEEMADDLAARGPVDGLYLSLHGAMAVRGVPRPEAAIAKRLRAVVGPGVPIVATFDPHGNEDASFLAHADMALAVKYYPHYDEYLQGERAARALIAMIEGRFKPAHATRKLPILTPTVAQWTGQGPWLEAVSRALVWEARARDVTCNIFFGFPWSDVPDAGMTVQVFTDDDPALAQRICDDLSEALWRDRARLAGAAQVVPVAEGVARAADLVARGEGPVVICDHSDRSGAAGFVLGETLSRGLPRVLCATLTDAALVRRLLGAGIAPGDPFDAAVGGQGDPSAGAPVRLRGRVLAVGAGGAVPSEGIDITGQPFIAVAHGTGCVTVLTETLVQVLEPEWLRHFGLDPRDFDIICLKSRVHFRRGFLDTGFARHAVMVEPEAPFLGTTRLEGLAYTALDPQAFYPLNPDLDVDPRA